MSRLRPASLASVIVMIILSVLPGTAAACPNADESIFVGRRISFPSKILGEEKTLCVSMPEGYGNSAGKYPVLYTFYNGDAGFIHTAGIVRFLSSLRLAPEMIVVSVSVDGMRDLTPTKTEAYGPTSGGADAFLRFLREELLPFVDKEYRTKPQRLIWSHSIGGTLIIYALLAAPDLFQVHLTSSPYFIYDGNDGFLLQNAARFLKQRKGGESYLYMAVGNEPGLKPSIDAFEKILGENKPAGLAWDYVFMDKENHSSILVRSLTEGLRAYFGREGWTGRR